jgi:hypothetical protein
MPLANFDLRAGGNLEALRSDALLVRQSAAVVVNVEIAEALRQYADELERRAHQLEIGTWPNGCG